MERKPAAPPAAAPPPAPTVPVVPVTGPEEVEYVPSGKTVELRIAEGTLEDLLSALHSAASKLTELVSSFKTINNSIVNIEMREPLVKLYLHLAARVKTVLTLIQSTTHEFTWDVNLFNALYQKYYNELLQQLT